MRGKEPRWLRRLVVDSIHIEQLKEHGGLPGVRDENALEAALTRSRNKWVYVQSRGFAQKSRGAAKHVSHGR